MCRCHDESQKRLATGSNFQEDDRALPLQKLQYYSMDRPLSPCLSPEPSRTALAWAGMSSGPNIQI